MCMPSHITCDQASLLILSGRDKNKKGRLIAGYFSH